MEKKTIIIDKYIATPIGIAKYNDKKKRYYIRYWNNMMPLHKALFLHTYRRDRKRLRNLEIHHIDGNKFNNQLNNLIALTHEEHLWIHTKIPKVEYNIRIIKNTYYDAKLKMKRRKKNGKNV